MDLRRHVQKKKKKCSTSLSLVYELCLTLLGMSNQVHHGAQFDLVKLNPTESISDLV